MSRLYLMKLAMLLSAAMAIRDEIAHDRLDTEPLPAVEPGWSNGTATECSLAKADAAQPSAMVAVGSQGPTFYEHTSLFKIEVGEIGPILHPPTQFQFVLGFAAEMAVKELADKRFEVSWQWSGQFEIMWFSFMSFFTRFTFSGKVEFHEDWLLVKVPLLEDAAKLVMGDESVRAAQAAVTGMAIAMDSALTYAYVTYLKKMDFLAEAALKLWNGIADAVNAIGDRLKEMGEAVAEVLKDPVGAFVSWLRSLWPWRGGSLLEGGFQPRRSILGDHDSLRLLKDEPDHQRLVQEAQKSMPHYPPPRVPTPGRSAWPAGADGQTLGPSVGNMSTAQSMLEAEHESSGAWECHNYRARGEGDEWCRGSPVKDGWRYKASELGGGNPGVSCGTCWCCKQPVAQLDWKCHYYDESSGQDRNWCRTASSLNDGFEYATSDSAECGGCGCCKRPAQVNDFEQQDYDCSGGEIRSTQTLTLQDCALQCRGDPHCDGFSFNWNPYGTSECVTRDASCTADGGGRTEGKYYSKHSAIQTCSTQCKNDVCKTLCSATSGFGTDELDALTMGVMHMIGFQSRFLDGLRTAKDECKNLVAQWNSYVASVDDWLEEAKRKAGQTAADFIQKYTDAAVDWVTLHSLPKMTQQINNLDHSFSTAADAVSVETGINTSQVKQQVHNISEAAMRLSATLVHNTFTVDVMKKAAGALSLFGNSVLADVMNAIPHVPPELSMNGLQICEKQVLKMGLAVAPELLRKVFVQAFLPAEDKSGGFADKCLKDSEKVKDRGQIKEDMVLLNQGRDCYQACNGKSDYCPKFCGSGVCCSHGYSNSGPCKGRGVKGVHHHVCVAGPGTEEDKTMDPNRRYDEYCWENWKYMSWTERANGPSDWCSASGSSKKAMCCVWGTKADGCNGEHGIEGFGEYRCVAQTRASKGMLPIAAGTCASCLWNQDGQDHNLGCGKYARLWTGGWKEPVKAASYPTPYEYQTCMNTPKVRKVIEAYGAKEGTTTLMGREARGFGNLLKEWLDNKVPEDRPTKPTRITDFYAKATYSNGDGEREVKRYKPMTQKGEDVRDPKPRTESLTVGEQRFMQTGFNAWAAMCSLINADKSMCKKLADDEDACQDSQDDVQRNQGRRDALVFGEPGSDERLDWIIAQLWANSHTPEQLFARILQSPKSEEQRKKASTERLQRAKKLEDQMAQEKKKESSLVQARNERPNCTPKQWVYQIFKTVSEFGQDHVTAECPDVVFIMGQFQVGLMTPSNKESSSPVQFKWQVAWAPFCRADDAKEIAVWKDILSKAENGVAVPTNGYTETDLIHCSLKGFSLDVGVEGSFLVPPPLDLGSDELKIYWKVAAGAVAAGWPHELLDLWTRPSAVAMGTQVVVEFQLGFQTKDEKNMWWWLDDCIRDALVQGSFAKLVHVLVLGLAGSSSAVQDGGFWQKVMFWTKKIISALSAPGKCLGKYVMAEKLGYTNKGGKFVSGEDVVRSGKEVLSGIWPKIKATFASAPTDAASQLVDHPKWEEPIKTTINSGFTIKGTLTKGKTTDPGPTFALDFMTGESNEKSMKLFGYGAKMTKTMNQGMQWEWPPAPLPEKEAEGKEEDVAI